MEQRGEVFKPKESVRGLLAAAGVTVPDREAYWTVAGRLGSRFDFARGPELVEGGRSPNLSGKFAE